MTDRIEQFGRKPRTDKKLAAFLSVTGGTRQRCGDELYFAILFLAEGEHMKQYGRPITGVRWIIKDDRPYPAMKSAKRQSRPSDYLSGSDLEAFGNVLNREYADLGACTAWQRMKATGVLNYLDFMPDELDEDVRDDLLFLAKYTAM
jgi:hypothetical protein